MGLNVGDEVVTRQDMPTYTPGECIPAGTRGRITHVAMPHASGLVFVAVDCEVDGRQMHTSGAARDFARASRLQEG